MIVNGRKAILFHDFCKISFVLFSSLSIFFNNYMKFLSGKYCFKVCIMNALAFLSFPARRLPLQACEGREPNGKGEMNGGWHK
ncbi:hypothetical protein ACFVSS_25830, partial [Peribacillus butanolivorans]|uniref:hypothetical protein n=1 Tax=Peribacillus butanolivorans TaxID=421767 RepID=UPI003670F8BF